MNRYLVSFSQRIRFISDVLMILVSINLAHFVWYGHFPTLMERDPYSLFFLYLVFLWFTCAFMFPVYREQRVISITVTLTEFIKYLSIYVSLISISIVIARWNFVSREILIAFTLFYLTLGSGFRVLYRLYTYKVRARGQNSKRLLIVGVGAVASIIEKHIIQRPEMGYQIVGYLQNGENVLVRKRNLVIPQLESLYEYLKKNRVDEVCIAVSSGDRFQIRAVIDSCEQAGIRSWIVPDFFAQLNKGAVLDSFDGVPILRIRQEPLQNPANRIVKRLFDLIVASVSLVILMPPLMVVLFILNRIYSPGPLFFKQPRNGAQGGVFDCYKFRSMHVNRMGEFRQATQDDPRVSVVGKFLRRTNLDEIPQIINVLKGQMSIVGPRPHPVELNNQWQEEIGKYMVRHYVKPGLTGWAQVNGFRGETETRRKMIKRVQYDIWYIENWSFGLDMKIIIMTALRMVRGDKAAY